MKQLHNPPRHRFSLAATAALTASALTISLCAALATPTFAWFQDANTGGISTIQAATYSIAATDADSNKLQSPVTVGTSEGDLHGYILTASGTATTGYAQVDVTKADNTKATYFIFPIPQGKTVNLVIQAASGSKIEFFSGWGEPQAEGSQIVQPTSTFSLEEEAPLMAYIEDSETDSIPYTVPEGATLEAIAGHYGVSPEDILIFNGIDSIQPDDVIQIPNPATDTPYEPPQEYIVQEGDTLQSIADAHGVTLKALCQWNNLEVDTVIYQNMKLTIPVLYEPKPTEPETTEPAATEATETTEATEATEATEPTEPDTTAPEEEAEETIYVNGIPLYFQSDYPDTLYGDGTVQTSGCSVTCLTMVANAVTGYDYTVDELADYFGGRAINNMERLEIGSETLGLTFYKSENWDKTWEALQEGKIVIALMNGLGRDCLFTDSQHFIVLTGLTEDGERVLVNDPNKGNYEVWNLKNAFENGFTPNDLLLGYDGAWVYDRTLEETPARYSEPRLIKSEENKNYPEIDLTAEERELLARVIWVEAQGECAEGQQAVAEVVFNRMLSDQFGDTLNDVIYGEDQFRSVPYLEDAKPMQAQYQAIDRALYGDSILPKNVYYFATYATNTNVYKQIDNHIFCY